jgi:hypothetical protein
MADEQGLLGCTDTAVVAVCAGVSGAIRDYAHGHVKALQTVRQKMPHLMQAAQGLQK